MVFRIAAPYPRDSREIMLIEIKRILPPRARAYVFVRRVQFARFLTQRARQNDGARTKMKRRDCARI